MERYLERTMGRPRQWLRTHPAGCYQANQGHHRKKTPSSFIGCQTYQSRGSGRLGNPGAQSPPARTLGRVGGNSQEM
eukprot:16430524-Heterocapsa_arctica.AAC.1